MAVITANGRMGNGGGAAENLGKNWMTATAKKKLVHEIPDKYSYDQDGTA
jgi:hypothetical protein